MRKFALSVVCLVFLVGFIGFSSAGALPFECLPGTSTIGGGVFLSGDDWTTVANVTVVGECTSSILNRSVIVNTTSTEIGSYVLVFSDENMSTCAVGDNIIITAFKDGMVGYENTTLTKVAGTLGDGCMKVNIGLTNVPLVPEFGLLVGTITILGALGMFFVIRRH